MPRARALVAAVPQRVWTAVAGLVLLASLGVTLVLAAGLSTWQGAVSNPSDKGNAQPPGSVVRPPSSAVIVVPTPHTNRPPAAAPPHPAAARPAAAHPVLVTVTPAPAPVPAPVTAPVAAPPVAVPVPPAPVTASPRIRHGGDATEGSHAHRGDHRGHGNHGNHGKHLGWFKNRHGKHS